MDEAVSSGPARFILLLRRAAFRVGAGEATSSQPLASAVCLLCLPGDGSVVSGRGAESEQWVLEAVTRSRSSVPGRADGDRGMKAKEGVA